MASNAINPNPPAEPVVPEGHLICPTCKQAVNVGSGGEANLKANHQDKPPCLARKHQNELDEKNGPKPEKKKPVFASLQNFFTKPKKLVPSTVPTPLPLYGTPITPSHRSVPVDDNTGGGEPEISAPVRVCAEAQALLVVLKARLELIPAHAPLADASHPLAPFSHNPEDDVELNHRARDVDWEQYIEPMMKRAFGWGNIQPELALDYVRRGSYGLDGFLNFFRYFVEERGLRGHLITGYMEVLLRAMEARFPTASDSAAARPAAKAVSDTEIIRLPSMAEDRYADDDLGNLRPCIGMQLRFPEGKSHHTDYPFGLHRKYSLSWDYYSKGERFYIQSQACTRGLCAAKQSCRPCDKLLSDSVLKGIFQRIQNGTPENIPFAFMPISVLIDSLRRKSDLFRGLKLTRLNDLRALTSKTGQLEEHKQFVMAVASGKVERVAQLVRACLNNHVGIRGLVERYQRACQVLYNPKGFDEDDIMLGLLILRLGGARLAGIVHRAIGLPGLSTLRSHTIIRPLRPSPAMPTQAEIEANIALGAEGEPESTGPRIIVHRVLMLDEIAVEQRPRWDDKTNKILGACRECSHKVSLDLNTAADLEVFFAALDDGDIHLASEATVAAFGALSKDPRVYSPRPCLISGTDKHETGAEHSKLLKKLMDAGYNKRKRGNITYRTICISSDGEAKRGLAMVLQTMTRTLSADHPTPETSIYPLLSPLELMNFRVGEDDITCDKDYRHVVKTLRNLLMRLRGVKVAGCVITPAIIKQHLRANGHSQEQVNSFLNPNDKQDVLLGYQLLKALWSLPLTVKSADPIFVRAHDALRMLGQLGYHLLMPYIFIELDLHQQLVHLSTAAHLLFFLYRDEKAGTSFMANQTYINLMIMIKNVFFCVAKAKMDTPTAEFFIILLGTDRLEVLFGLIRTAIGTDANVDIYQLASRISGLLESVLILARRPQWDRSPRRLKLPMIINEAGEVSANADHITPASWKGDVHVGVVNLLTAWKQGRQKTEELIPRARADFTVCAATAGIDIFAPMGNSLVLSLGEDSPDDFELDPDLYKLPGPPALHHDAEGNASSPKPGEAKPSTDSSYTPDGDVEDALAIAEPQGKFSPYLEIEGKKVTKARALSMMMRFRGQRSSTDRLKRVAGLPSFSSPTMTSGGIIMSDNALGTAAIRIGNPVALIVSCDERYFLAIAQVNNITLTALSVDSISLDLLRDSSARISVQILRLLPATVDDDPTKQHDWCWSSKLEAAICNNVAGNLVQPMNPTVTVLEAGRATYLFDSASLLTVAANIYDQMVPQDFLFIPKVKRTDHFPYRRERRACFIVEHDAQIRGNPDTDVAGACSKCSPAVMLDSNGQRVLEHNAAHILLDPSLANQQPCGICLQPGSVCTLFFTKRRGAKTSRQIDWKLSKCSNPVNFNMKTAMTFSAASPCTNSSVQCPLCDAGLPLVWTYNLAAHYRDEHNRPTGPYTFISDAKDAPLVEYIRSVQEEHLVRARFAARYKKPVAVKSKSKQLLLPISEAHSSRMALRPALDSIPEEAEADVAVREHIARHAVFSAKRADSESETESEGDVNEPSPPSEDEDFGPEIEHDSPGPLPPTYPDVDDEAIEYFDEAPSTRQVEMLALAADLALPNSDEVPAPEDPADVPLPDLPPQQDWDLPLLGGHTSQRGRKRRVRAAAIGTCDCGEVVPEEARGNLESVVECGKIGCETGWYHRACMADESFPKNWFCESCMAQASDESPPLSQNRAPGPGPALSSPMLEQFFARFRAERDPASDNRYEWPDNSDEEDLPPPLEPCQDSDWEDWLPCLCGHTVDLTNVITDGVHAFTRCCVDTCETKWYHLACVVKQDGIPYQCDRCTKKGAIQPRSDDAPAAWNTGVPAHAVTLSAVWKNGRESCEKKLFDH
ncbi:hypothetical protein B0H16DRAFT_1762357 [Mycena metata]|uniref:Zinc finger PHD-type domain-containing protein n=1 Tax=Mycena metata TaxID=1033252 RepID=A0AAD7IAI0_9AGAR|nr:hypothetical protein B0H16DRAFT_1762357 [Mycena metata]